MENFKADPSCEVLLVSLRAGGVGLNLTMASRVYLLEPFWNPAVENQATDRIHRLGQQRAVKLTRYIMNDTIEFNMREIQKRKMDLANLSLSQTLPKAELAQRRIENLKVRYPTMPCLVDFANARLSRFCLDSQSGHTPDPPQSFLLHLMYTSSIDKTRFRTASRLSLLLRIDLLYNTRVMCFGRVPNLLNYASTSRTANSPSSPSGPTTTSWETLVSGISAWNTLSA